MGSCQTQLCLVPTYTWTTTSQRVLLTWENNRTLDTAVPGSTTVCTWFMIVPTILDGSCMSHVAS